MNRIKEALEAGKAIHCRTEDKTRRLFEIMDWGDDENERGYHYWLSDAYDDGWNCSRDRGRVLREHNVVEFSTLARYRLAKALGVEDGQPIKFRDKTYKIDEHGVLRKQSYCQATGGKHWTHTRATHVCNLINHPEEITPCPVWSEETIKAARAAELLGFTDVEKTSMETFHFYDFRGGSGGHWHTALKGQFAELTPGQTVKLSVIK